MPSFDFTFLTTDLVDGQITRNPAPQAVLFEVRIAQSVAYDLKKYDSNPNFVRLSKRSLLLVQLQFVVSR
jgi:hypothetical protein